LTGEITRVYGTITLYFASREYVRKETTPCTRCVHASVRKHTLE